MTDEQIAILARRLSAGRSAFTGRVLHDSPILDAIQAGEAALAEVYRLRQERTTMISTALAAAVVDDVAAMHSRWASRWRRYAIAARKYNRHLREQLRAVSRALGNEWCDATYVGLAQQVVRYLKLAEAVRDWRQAVAELNGVHAAEQAVMAALDNLDTTEVES